MILLTGRSPESNSRRYISRDQPHVYQFAFSHNIEV